VICRKEPSRHNRRRNLCWSQVKKGQERKRKKAREEAGGNKRRKSWNGRLTKRLKGGGEVQLSAIRESEPDLDGTDPDPRDTKSKERKSGGSRKRTKSRGERFKERQR